MVRFHDVRPRAVVRCVTDADVSEAIGFAKRVGLRIAIRSGGHCVAGRSSTDRVVMDVSPNWLPAPATTPRRPIVCTRLAGR
jgi:FAD/FMN-containing dehydrogenase